HAGQVFAERRQFALADADRERRDLVEQVLLGDVPAEGPLADAASAYGIGIETPLMVGSAAAVGWRLEADAAHAVSVAVARSCRGRAKVLAAVRQLELVLVLSLSADASPTEVCSAVESAQERLARDQLPLAVGLSTVAAGVSEVARAYEEARSARDAVAAGGVAALPK